MFFRLGGTPLQKAKILIVMVCTIIITALGTYAGMEWLEQNQDEEIKQENGTDRLIHPSETDADNVNLAKVEKAFGLIKASYVEEVDSSVLIEGAIEGMLSKLNDPYSVYMNEEKAKQFNSSLDSSFEGIGAEVSEVDGKIIIVSLINIHRQKKQV